MTESSNVLVTVRERIALLVINRPEKRNALDAATRRQILTALDALRSSAEVRVVVITGAGDKAFVAGADIAEFEGRTPIQQFETMSGPSIFDAVESFPRPVIAMINGFALGGGCELALACDLIYASENARFGLPEVSLGILPGFGGTQRLSRLVGKARAKELIFTGDMIDAARAKAIGLVLEVVPLPQLLPHARAALERVAKKGPLAVRRAKEAIDRGAEMELSDGNRMEQELFADLFETSDRREGMTAFAEKRPPTFTGR
jgi:enoyl-CoA hydratase